MGNDGWFVYILYCRNGAFYTGISTDVDRRLREHRAGKRGARSLRGNRPERIVFRCALASRSEAQRLEYRIKCLNRRQKQALIDGEFSVDELLPGDSAEVAGTAAGVEVSDNNDDHGQ